MRTPTLDSTGAAQERLNADTPALPICVADVMVRRPKKVCPDSPLAAIRALLQDDHVHMVLVVAPGGRLVTTIERSDLCTGLSGSTTARELGTLTDRTVAPWDSLHAANVALARGRRRRLAVIDDVGTLVGLLCLKRSGAGYCSDDGIRARAADSRRV